MKCKFIKILKIFLFYIGKLSTGCRTQPKTLLSTNKGHLNILFSLSKKPRITYIFAKRNNEQILVSNMITCFCKPKIHNLLTLQTNRLVDNCTFEKLNLLPSYRTKNIMSWTEMRNLRQNSSHREPHMRLSWKFFLTNGQCYRKTNNQ